MVFLLQTRAEQLRFRCQTASHVFGIKKHEWLNSEKSAFSLFPLRWNTNILSLEDQTDYAIWMRESPWVFGQAPNRYINWYLTGCEGGYSKRKGMRWLYLSPTFYHCYLSGVESLTMQPHPTRHRRGI